MCSITLSGDKLPLYAVRSGKTMQCWQSFTHHHDIIMQPHDSSWLDEDVIVDWMCRVIQPYTQNKPCVLLLDNSKVHKTEKVLHAARQLNALLVYVPKYATGTTQPLDVGVFGPVKKQMIAAIDEIRYSSIQHIAKQPVSLEQFYVAWHQRTRDDNINAFIKAINVKP